MPSKGAVKRRMVGRWVDEPAPLTADELREQLDAARAESDSLRAAVDRRDRAFDVAVAAVFLFAMVAGAAILVPR